MDCRGEGIGGVQKILLKLWETINAPLEHNHHVLKTKPLALSLSLARPGETL